MAACFAPNKMNRLLKLTAILETATGLALTVVPSVVRLLLGSELDTSAAVMLARVAGAALVALGVACWPGQAVSVTASRRFCT
jgi:hypothetical protein